MTKTILAISASLFILLAATTGFATTIFSSEWGGSINDSQYDHLDFLKAYFDDDFSMTLNNGETFNSFGLAPEIYDGFSAATAPSLPDSLLGEMPAFFTLDFEARLENDQKKYVVNYYASDYRVYAALDTAWQKGVEIIFPDQPIIDEAWEPLFGSLASGFMNLERMESQYPDGTAPVPEPATILLLGTGLLGIAGVGRKKFKS